MQRTRVYQDTDIPINRFKLSLLRITRAQCLWLLLRNALVFDLLHSDFAITIFEAVRR